jgi:hypothetical protein
MTEETGADVIEEPEATEETEADAEVTEVEEPESDAESPPAGEEDTETKPDPVQKRIDKLTRRFRDAERTAAQVKAENEELRKQLEAAPQQTEPLKKLADFEYDEGKYAEYLFSQAREVARTEAQQVAKGFHQETSHERALEDFRTRETAFADTVKDYNKVVYDDDLKISPVMADEIHESDMGPELAYYLGKNPDISLEISKLPARAAVRRITLLETELAAEKGKTGKKVSGAPPPPPKIKGTDPGLKVSTTDPRSDKMSDEEWFKAEEARKAKLMRR